MNYTAVILSTFFFSSCNAADSAFNRTRFYDSPTVASSLIPSPGLTLFAFIRRYWSRRESRPARRNTTVKLSVGCLLSLTWLEFLSTLTPLIHLEILPLWLRGEYLTLGSTEDLRLWSIIFNILSYWKLVDTRLSTDTEYPPSLTSSLLFSRNLDFLSWSSSTSSTCPVWCLELSRL